MKQMSAKALASVWSSSLLRKTRDMTVKNGSELARELARCEEIVYLMILHYATLYPDGPPQPFSMQHRTKERPSVFALRNNKTTPQHVVESLKSTQS